MTYVFRVYEIATDEVSWFQYLLEPSIQVSPRLRRPIKLEEVLLADEYLSGIVLTRDVLQEADIVCTVAGEDILILSRVVHVHEVILNSEFASLVHCLVEDPLDGSVDLVIVGRILPSQSRVVQHKWLFRRSKSQNVAAILLHVSEHTWSDDLDAECRVESSDLSHNGGEFGNELLDEIFHHVEVELGRLSPVAIPPVARSSGCKVNRVLRHVRNSAMVLNGRNVEIFFQEFSLGHGCAILHVIGEVPDSLLAGSKIQDKGCFRVCVTVDTVVQECTQHPIDMFILVHDQTAPHSFVGERFQLEVSHYSKIWSSTAQCLVEVWMLRRTGYHDFTGSKDDFERLNIVTGPPVYGREERDPTYGRLAILENRGVNTYRRVSDLQRQHLRPGHQ